MEYFWEYFFFPLSGLRGGGQSLGDMSPFYYALTNWTHQTQAKIENILYLGKKPINM